MKQVDGEMYDKEIKAKFSPSIVQRKSEMVRRLIEKKPQRPYTLVQRLIEAQHNKLKTITEQTNNSNKQEQDFTRDGSNPTSISNGSNPSKENLDEENIHVSEISSESPNTKRRK